jgi:hypothetical protein
MYALRRPITPPASFGPPSASGYSRRVQPVAVRILHPSATSAAGPLERALSGARSAHARRLAVLFEAQGATDVQISQGPPDGRTFGARLRDVVAGVPDGAGLVVLGSGSLPLARERDVADFVGVAASGERQALANNRFSADVVAIGSVAALAAVPELATDNALPRWLEETAGFRVDDLRRRWRVGIDLDSPLDVVLVGERLPDEGDGRYVVERLAGLRAVAGNPRAELVVSGRSSGATLRWLERRTASRTRAMVEERGLRAAESIEAADGMEAARPVRPPRSLLGLLLEDRGPEALGPALAELGDGALVDTRVLLAHRLGSDEAGWPPAEDRFASDLLLPERVRDSWLRALTASARDASIPVVLGGHTLVGPGIRLALGGRAAGMGRR